MSFPALDFMVFLLLCHKNMHMQLKPRDTHKHAHTLTFPPFKNKAL